MKPSHPKASSDRREVGRRHYQSSHQQCLPILAHDCPSILAVLNARASSFRLSRNLADAGPAHNVEIFLPVGAACSRKAIFLYPAIVPADGHVAAEVTRRSTFFMGVVSDARRGERQAIHYRQQAQ